MLNAFPPLVLPVLEGEAAFAVLDPAVLVAKVLLEADEESVVWDETFSELTAVVEGTASK